MQMTKRDEFTKEYRQVWINLQPRDCKRALKLAHKGTKHTHTVVEE